MTMSADNNDAVCGLRADLADANKLIEHLDRDNEHLRTRLLDTLGWWENDVTAAIEREHALLEQNSNLEREISALHATITMRLARPARRLLARIRAGRDTEGGS